MWSFITAPSSLYLTSPSTFAHSILPVYEQKLQVTLGSVYLPLGWNGALEQFLWIKPETILPLYLCTWVYLCPLWDKASGFWEIMLTACDPHSPCVTRTLLSQTRSANKPRLTSSTSAWTCRNVIVCGSSVKEQDCVCLLLCQIVLPPSAQPLLGSDGILLKLPSLPSVKKKESLFPPCIGSLHSSQLCNVAAPGDQSGTLRQ